MSEYRLKVVSFHAPTFQADRQGLASTALAEKPAALLAWLAILYIITVKAGRYAPV